MTAEHLAAEMKILVGALSILGIAFSGWNLYLQNKIKEISALWAWKDNFISQYQEDRLVSIEKFATKSDMEHAFERLDQHLAEVRRSVDRLRDKLDEKTS